MRTIALFIYNNENEYTRVRNEIANFLLLNNKSYENITLHTEDGPKNILEYIIWMRQDCSWSGNLEFIAASNLYNINIHSLIDIINNNFQIL